MRRWKSHGSERGIGASQGLALLVCTASLVALANCASSGAKNAKPGKVERGLASWYGAQFHGRPTASGEIFDMYAPSAAHKSLPLGTWVRVKNVENGRSLEVRINDRGPFVRGRIIDLSFAAAQRLGMVEAGVVKVEVKVLPPPGHRPRSRTPYTVQVAAFRDRERATELRQELRSDYPEARVRSDGDWHRVQIGVFKRRKKANRLREELVRLGFSAIVISY